MFVNKQKVPFHRFLTFQGSVENIPCTILKDDGASTNIMSRMFYEQNQSVFEKLRSNVILSHSSQGSEEVDCEMVDEAGYILEATNIFPDLYWPTRDTI